VRARPKKEVFISVRSIPFSPILRMTKSVIRTAKAVPDGEAIGTREESAASGDIALAGVARKGSGRCRLQPKSSSTEGRQPDRRCAGWKQRGPVEKPQGAGWAQYPLSCLICSGLRPSMSFWVSLSTPTRFAFACTALNLASGSGLTGAAAGAAFALAVRVGAGRRS